MPTLEDDDLTARIEGTGSFDEVLMSSWLHRWVLEAGSFVDWSQMPLGGSHVEIFTDCHQVGALSVVTEDGGVSLEEYIASLDPIEVKEPAEKKAKVGAKAKAKVIDPALLAEFPSLATDLLAGARKGSGPSGAGSTEDDDDVFADPLPNRKLTDDELMELFTAVEERRSEWHGLRLSKDTSEEFKVSFRMGTWTMEKKGKPCDTVLASASGKTSKEWCASYGLQDNRSFATSYGHEVAVAFARAWCSRMGHFFGIWRSQPNHKYVFTPEDIESWKPPHDFVSSQADLKDQQKRHIGNVFGEKPRVPKWACSFLWGQH